MQTAGQREDLINITRDFCSKKNKESSQQIATHKSSALKPFSSYILHVGFNHLIKRFYVGVLYCQNIRKAKLYLMKQFFEALLGLWFVRANRIYGRYFAKRSHGILSCILTENKTMGGKKNEN